MSKSETVIKWLNIGYGIQSKSFFNRKKQDITLLENVSGELSTGQMLSVLGKGPSGSGKTTFLETISGRRPPTSGSVSCHPSSSFCEQEDSLMGVLTVRETLIFSAKLSNSHTLSDLEINQLVNLIIDGLGLKSVESNIIGTPIQRGVSGGQRRRVSIACALTAMPKVLFLDEPTSGLDITSSYEVMKSIKSFSVKNNIAVIATIHSPNFEIFSLFDKTLLLAKGKTIYNGFVNDVVPYFQQLGYHFPQFSNPADIIMSIVNTDFSNDYQEKDIHNLEDGEYDVIGRLSEKWMSFDKSHCHQLNNQNLQCDFSNILNQSPRSSLITLTNKTFILTKRNFVNYMRNALAFGVRLGMYVGMGVLLATVWVNLSKTDDKIQDRLSVHFFSVAFLGFMSVAGIPSFLEERNVIRREINNKLYGPLPFTIANTLTILPFLFLCTLVFTIISYWSIGLHEGATHFFRWLAFLFLGILAAEFQSLLVASIFPIFVVALAITAFLNGFWMVTQGYFIKAVNLPRFWYYWAHWINYETFAFVILSYSDLSNLVFDCSGSIEDNTCQCSFSSSLVSQGQCAVSGDDVLRSLDYDGISMTLYAFLVVIIILVYRVLFYIVLKYKK